MTPLDSNSYSENGISPRTLVPKPQSDFCSQLIRSKFRYQTWARKLKHYIRPLHSRKMLCFSPNLRMTVSPLFTNQGNRHGKAGTNLTCFLFLPYLVDVTQEMWPDMLVYAILTLRWTIVMAENLTSSLGNEFHVPASNHLVLPIVTVRHNQMLD